MDIYISKYEEEILLDKFFNNKKICFLDIETTGFHRKNDIIYLVGILYQDNNSWFVKQFFCCNVNKEKLLISKLASFLKTFQTIITYNGEAFDINFLNHKFKYYNINYSIPKNKNFDLYKLIKQENIFLNLDNLKLEYIEKFIGIYRQDTLTGKECIRLYYDFLNNKDEKCKELILQHNYEDLIYLPNIFKVLDISKKKKSIHISLPYLNTTLEIKDIKIEKDILKINCYCPLRQKMPLVFYQSNYNFHWESNSSLFIQLEVNSGLLSTKEKCFYVFKEKIPLNENIKDLSQYNLPNNIVSIKIGNRYQFETIKIITKKITEYTLNHIFS